MKQITENLYEISLKGVNTHLITLSDELILIDTGSADDEQKIAAALAKIGRDLADLTHIIVTHCHPDHAGSLAALQTRTNAITIMHPIDADLVQNGIAMRPLTPPPSLLAKLLFRIFIAPAPKTITPARIDQTVENGDILSLAGGLRVIHAPGHSAGQIALLWEARGILFVGDAVMNLPRLNYSLGYEDFELGRQTAAQLASFNFDIACFGHGKPLLPGASRAFGKKFGLG